MTIFKFTFHALALPAFGLLAVSMPVHATTKAMPSPAAGTTLQDISTKCPNKDVGNDLPLTDTQKAAIKKAVGKHFGTPWTPLQFDEPLAPIGLDKATQSKPLCYLKLSPCPYGSADPTIHPNELIKMMGRGWMDAPLS